MPRRGIQNGHEDRPICSRAASRAGRKLLSVTALIATKGCDNIREDHGGTPIRPTNPARVKNRRIEATMIPKKARTPTKAIKTLQNLLSTN